MKKAVAHFSGLFVSVEIAECGLGYVACEPSLLCFFVRALSVVWVVVCCFVLWPAFGAF